MVLMALPKATSNTTAAVAKKKANKKAMRHISYSLNS